MSQWFRNCSWLANEHAIINFTRTSDLEIRYFCHKLSNLLNNLLHDFFLYSLFLINFIEIKEFYRDSRFWLDSPQIKDSFPWNMYYQICIIKIFKLSYMIIALYRHCERKIFFILKSKTNLYLIYTWFIPVFYTWFHIKNKIWILKY